MDVALAAHAIFVVDGSLAETWRSSLVGRTLSSDIRARSWDGGGRCVVFAASDCMQLMLASLLIFSTSHPPRRVASRPSMGLKIA